MIVIQELWNLEACKSLNVECKCWMAESEHIAFSERMGVCLFFFFAPFSLSQVHNYTKLVFEDLAEKQSGHKLL